MQEAGIGILIRTYDRYIDNMEPLLDSLQSHYKVVGYDLIERLPPDNVKAKCDSFFVHKGEGLGWIRKQEGDRAVKAIGMAMLASEGLAYILSVTGDAVIDKPEDIAFLVDALKGNDLMGTQWWDICGDLIMFGKADKMYKVFCDIPGGPPQGEIKMMRAFYRNSIKFAIHKCTKEDKGIWGSVIGYQRGHDNYPPNGENHG